MASIRSFGTGRTRSSDTVRFVLIASDWVTSIALLILVALSAILLLPIITIDKVYRWIELRCLYNGDVKAHDKDRWRGL